jgi:hypothetical protein
MRKTVCRQAFSVLFLVTGLQAANAVAAEEPLSMAAGPTVFVSTDNENFNTKRAGVDFFPSVRNQDAATGVRYRHHEFSQDGWSRSGEQVALVAKGPLAAGVRAWQAETGLMTEGRHTLLTLDGGYALPIAQGTSAEFFVDRDFVETQAALDQGIHFTFVGGSLEHQPHPKVTLIGIAGYQHFSDDNERKHARFRAIFQPDLDLGLTFQYRYRYYTSTPNETRRAYFNPERYQENMLLAGWRYRSSGWVGSVLAGAGRQSVAETPPGPSRLLEIGVDSPVKASQLLALRAGYLRTAAFGGPDYRYQYIQANWTLRF